MALLKLGSGELGGFTGSNTRSYAPIPQVVP